MGYPVGAGIGGTKFAHLFPVAQKWLGIGPKVRSGMEVGTGWGKMGQAKLEGESGSGEQTTASC